MERLLFVYGWLSALTDGRFFRFIFSNLLRLGAIVLTIYLIGDAIENIQQMLELSHGWVTMKLLIPGSTQFVVLLGGYAVIHLLLLRSEEIRTLYDPRYALSEVVTVLSRLSGELLFVLSTSITLILLIQMQTAPEEYLLLPQLQQQLLPWIAPYSAPVIAGSGIALGFAGLVAGYLLSEMLEMVLRLSRNSEPQPQS